MTDINLDHLKQVATNAVEPASVEIAGLKEGTLTYEFDTNPFKASKFYETFDPPTVLALIDRIENLEATIQRVRDNSRHALTSQAAQEATAYYGTPCVEIILTNEEAETTYIDDTRFGEPPTLSTGPTTYTADYTARIAHAVVTKTYGPDKCADCGKDSWPHSPIPANERR